MNWRNIPHPEYGNYGGKYNHGKDHTQSPIDLLDLCFKQHDLELKNSNKVKSKVWEADSNLFISLLTLNPFKLEYISIPFYGQLYWISCLLVFGIRHTFFK